MPRFHIKVRTRNPKADLALLAGAKLNAKRADENHIDVSVDADKHEDARQQVIGALGKDREDDVE